jgi:thiol-disulfide isomerase/thioredoxin
VVSGSFAPIVRNLGLIGLLCGATSVAHAATDTAHADVESALLHRQLDLSRAQQWDPKRNRWLPLYLPPAKVYVVNLWSVFCKPCLTEFPQLRLLSHGWQSQRQVQFVFLSDPPTDATDAEVAAFWHKNASAVPDTGPARSDTIQLRQSLENDQNPITLLLDEHFVVRQAFVGSLGARPIGRAIERLLQATSPPQRPHPGKAARR